MTHRLLGTLCFLLGLTGTQSRRLAQFVGTPLHPNFDKLIEQLLRTVAVRVAVFNLQCRIQAFAIIDVLLDDLDAGLDSARKLPPIEIVTRNVFWPLKLRDRFFDVQRYRAGCGIDDLLERVLSVVRSAWQLRVQQQCLGDVKARNEEGDQAANQQSKQRNRHDAPTATLDQVDVSTQRQLRQFNLRHRAAWSLPFATMQIAAL